MEWPWAVSTTMTSTPARAERLRALGAVGPGPDGGADAQAPGLVLDGVGVAVGLEEILDGDEPDQLAVLDDQELLDAVLVEQLLGAVVGDAGRHGDQLPGHQHVHRLVEVLLEADVAGGEDAHRRLALDHRHAADVVLAHHGERLAERLDGAAR